MASTILSKLKNHNVSGQNGSNDMVSQFLSFKKQIESSGKNPQDILNEMLASGKVPPAMYNKARTLATVFANKIKLGR